MLFNVKVFFSIKTYEFIMFGPVIEYRTFDSTLLELLHFKIPVLITILLSFVNIKYGRRRHLGKCQIVCVSVDYALLDL